MDKERLKKAMKTSISEVLEKMFFLPLDFSDASGPGDILDPRTEAMIAIQLDFKGPLSGRFVLFIPKELGRDLTADFMGSEPDAVAEEHVVQTAEEIINMIAGSTFRALDDRAIFDLGIPEALPLEAAWSYAAEADDGVFVGVDTLESHMGLFLMKA